LIVLDTHALLWWVGSPKQVGKAATAAIDGADAIGVPAIVFWEVALLARLERIALDRPSIDWVEAVLSIPRVVTLPLTASIAVRADSLDMHADPADRFIVATVIEHGAKLATKDKALRRLRSVETVW
jgi:PIN domain nuclease of toxin-antitoxin system